MKILSNPRLSSAALGAALLLSGSIHYAQAAPTDLRARTQKQVQNLFKNASFAAQNLNLTPAQKSKMAAIAHKNSPLIKEIWSNSSFSQKVKASRIHALENQASAVLTTAQKRKIVQARGQAMAQIFQTALWISSELKLSEEQQGELKDVVMTNYHLASGTQGNFGALRGLLFDTSHQIDRVLTPEQQSKWAVIKTTARQEMVKQTRVWRQSNRV